MAERFRFRAHSPQSRPRPWFERADAERFHHDDAIVREHYPGLGWNFDTRRTRAWLEGHIAITEPGCSPDEVAVQVRFPLGYPREEPEAFETGRRFPWINDRHLIPTSGRCCLWLPPLSPWSPIDPDALRSFLDELLVFIDRQLICDATGRWPGPAWDHGVFGYWDFLVEKTGSERLADAFRSGLTTGRNAPCPCESGRRYKSCHARAFAELARLIGPEYCLRLSRWRRLDGRWPESPTGEKLTAA